MAVENDLLYGGRVHVQLPEHDAAVDHVTMFTFSTSSQKPTFRVRCHHCPWMASGEARIVGGKWVNPVFSQADEHVCVERRPPSHGPRPAAVGTLPHKENEAPR